MKIKAGFFIPLFLLFSLTLFSQESTTSKLPDAKTTMLELNLNLFGPNVFSFEQLQAKFWVTDQFVARLAVGYNQKTFNQDKNDYEANEKQKNKYSAKSVLYTIKPGVEYRILRNSKVSPYVGLEFQYKKHLANEEFDRHVQIDWNSQMYEIEHTKIEGAYGDYRDLSADYSGRAFNSVGGNLLFGSDFYFVKNMYFGFEFGLGYHAFQYEKIKITKSKVVEDTNLPSFNENKLEFYYNSAIRFGVWF